MNHLYLVESPQSPRRKGQTARRWSAAPYDLARQPQRPGELCSEIRLTTPAPDPTMAQRARASGLPIVLWATLAVECQRVLELVIRSFELPPALALQTLDAASAKPPLTIKDRSSGSGSRLSDYARALLNARPLSASVELGPVMLRVSTTMITAWMLACEQAGESLEDWASEQLTRPPRELVRWESSAAAGGQTLAEWALLQAARRLRCASTLAQTAE
jgi:hypothetical protein